MTTQTLDDLERLHDKEEHNFAAARALLAEHGTYELLGTATECYALMAQMVSVSGIPETRDDMEFAFICSLRSRYYLQKGCLEIMRGHSGDGLGQLRQAVEAAGVADLVRRQPKFAQRWIESIQDEAHYKTYLGTFNSGQFFPDTDPMMVKLKVAYDIAAKRSHPSPHAFASRLSVTPVNTAGEQDFSYSFFDFSDPQEAQSTVLQAFLLTVGTHAIVLDVYQRALAISMARDVNNWNLRRNALEAALGVQRARLDR